MRSARRPGIVASVPQRRKRPGSEPNRRWRDYQTGAGRRPVRDFLASLDDDDAAAILAAMKDVAKNGLAVAERLDEEIHEVKADGRRQTYRVLFSPQGRHDQVLLSLEAFSKKTQKTPPAKLRLAKRRLREWQSRGD
jgi:phage-related protein